MVCDKRDLKEILNSECFQVLKSISNYQKQNLIFDTAISRISWILSVSEYYLTTQMKIWTSDWHRLSARGARYRHGRGNFFGWKATDIRQIPVTFCWFSIPWRLQKISTFLLISKSETQAADFHECQQRCVETEGCEHFSFFEDPDNRTIKGYDLSSFSISQTLKDDKKSVFWDPANAMRKYD